MCTHLLGGAAACNEDMFTICSNHELHKQQLENRTYASQTERDRPITCYENGQTHSSRFEQCYI
jgi:hypothetical protein